MYIPEKLKVNKFKDVRLPKPSQIFAQYGAFQPAGAMYSGEEAVLPMSKLDQIRTAQNTADYYEHQAELAAAQAAREAEAAKSAPLGD